MYRADDENVSVNEREYQHSGSGSPKWNAAIINVVPPAPLTSKVSFMKRVYKVHSNKMSINMGVILDISMLP